MRRCLGELALILFLILFLCVFLGSCGMPTGLSNRAPVTITAFHIFGNKMNDPDQAWFYVDWINNTGNTIDSIELTISGSFSGNTYEEENPTILTLRLLEPDQVKPGAHNQNKLQPIPIFLEHERYTAAISKITVADGTQMREALSNSIDSMMWENKGTGEMPVRLDEACFWNPSPNSYDINYHVDWTNRSADKEIFGVFYEIVPKDSDGSRIIDQDGNEVTIYRFFKEDEYILPHQSNNTYFGGFNRFDGSWVEDARIIDISIARVIDSTGAVWDNEDNAGAVTCELSGKKGYAFGDCKKYPAISKEVKKINDSLIDNGIDYGDPDVYVKPYNYCVIRYPVLDIRIDLTAENAVSPERVAFAYYSPHPNGNEAAIKDILETVDTLHLAVFPVVLKDIPYAEALDRIKEFNSNDKSYIDFEDTDYDTFEDVINILAPNKTIITAVVSAVGKDLYYPTNFFLWAKEAPYEQYRELEVAHRPR